MSKTKRLLIAGFILFILNSPALFAQDYSALTITPPQVSLEGAAWTGFGVPGNNEIRVRGDYAYVSPGEGDFQIVDIRDKSNPKIVGHLAVSFMGDVEVEGQIAYLQHPDALLPIDISDPFNPRLLNGVNSVWDPAVEQTVWDPEEGCIGQVRVRNGYLFITMHTLIGAGDGCKETAVTKHDFVVLDVKDPGNMAQVANLKLDTGAISLFLDGNYAYVGLVSGGVAIVDIGIPAQPVLKGFYRGEPGEAHPPYLIGTHGNLLVLATWNPYTTDFVSDPDISFVSSDPVQVILVDASNPANPVRKGHYQFADTPVFPVSAVGFQNYLYLVDTRRPVIMAGSDPFPEYADTRLLTLDIQDPTAPKLLHQYEREYSRMTYVSRDGEYLYVNEGFYGLRIFSLTDPATPRLIGSTPTASEGRYAWVNDAETLAYILDSGGGTRIHIIDVSDKANPVRRGFYWDGAHPSWTQFVGRGAFLYVPVGRDSGSSVDIIDVSNPDLPVKVGAFPVLQSWPENSRITLAGSYAYVAAITQNPATGSVEKVLRAYDISNPQSPVLRSRLSISAGQSTDFMPQLTVKRNLVYIVLPDEHTILTVDVLDPKQPGIVGKLVDNDKFVFPSHGDEWAGRLAIANGYAYILTGEDYTDIGGVNTLEHFHIVDVRDPANPVYKKAFADPTGVEHLFQVGDTFLNDIAAHDNDNLLLLSAYQAFPIYDLSDPLNPRFLLDVVEQGVVTPFGYPEAAAWSLGRLVGQRLYAPTTQGLNIIRIETTPTSVHQGNVEFPTAFALSQNYPNPFNPETTIGYQLPEPGNTTLSIFTLLGQAVRTLVNKNQPAGSYSVVWNGQDDLARELASGIYFYRLKVTAAGMSSVQTRKLLLMR